jgi:ADP-L-glycero-D-manno-heptose 6-epimerase
MYIVTGGAGFIGSNLVRMLTKFTKEDVLVVDNLSDGKKFLNISDLTIADYMDQDEFLSLIKNDDSFFSNVKCVFHQGACSDTTEWDGRYMMKNNYTFSKILLNACLEKNVRFIYASSAAVYGSSMDFKEQKKNEKPLNIYGYSKLLFDQYVRKLKLTNEQQVVGLRYFNVYGPGESHKGSMASVAYHFNEQIKLKNTANLFKGSHGYSDGEQQRGIYNLGTGKPTSFNAVASAIISWHKKGAINYIDFPKNLENAYQCYTSADLKNFRDTGCDIEFKDINEGIHQYLDHLSG